MFPTRRPNLYKRSAVLTRIELCWNLVIQFFMLLWEHHIKCSTILFCIRYLQPDVYSIQYTVYLQSGTVQAELRVFPRECEHILLTDRG